jgi:hypothetical protein
MVDKKTSNEGLKHQRIFLGITKRENYCQYEDKRYPIGLCGNIFFFQTKVFNLSITKLMLCSFASGTAITTLACQYSFE